MKKGNFGGSGAALPVGWADTVASFVQERQKWNRVLKAQRVVFGITLFLFSAAFVNAACAGQGPGPVTEVRGTLRTVSSDSVPLVGVTLQSTSGGLPQHTFTDNFGRFFFDHVPIGSYVILISVQGYAPVRRPIKVVAADPVIGLSITLKPRSTRHDDNVSANGSGIVSVRQLHVPGKARKEYRKGLKSAARGKTEDAIKHWKKSIQIFPQYADAYVQLSKTYILRSDFARATEAANRAIGIDGRNAGAYASLGYIYAREKDFTKAENAFANAVRLSESNWFSQYCLGRLMLGGKDAKGAYPHLLRASQLRPQNPNVEIALYNDLVKLGRAREALAKLDDFLTRFPNSPLAASAREKRKDLVKALTEEEQ